MPQKPNNQQQSTPESFRIVKPLINENEGFREKAYWDEKGKKWTIGNGLTYYPDGTKVKEGDTITRELNDKYVDFILNERLAKLSKYPNWSKLNPNEQAAVLDFAYNIGANWNEADNKNLILALTDQSKIKTLPSVMASYRLAGGKVSQGLINRRERGNKLFNTPYNQNNEENNKIKNPVQKPAQKVAMIEPMQQLPMISKDPSGMPSFDTRPSDA